MRGTLPIPAATMTSTRATRVIVYPARFSRYMPISVFARYAVRTSPTIIGMLPAHANGVTRVLSPRMYVK